MSAQVARREISHIVTSMLGAGIAIDSNPPISRRLGNVTHIAWPSVIILAEIPFGSVADYRWLLENRQYNLLLFDGAMIQARLMFQHDELIRQSLCYYPCPILLPVQDTRDDFSLADLVDRTLFDAVASFEWLAPLRTPETSPTVSAHEYVLRMRAPLRFDYDPEAQGPLHSAVHLHLGDQDCRIPVYAPMSFGNFVRFIFRSFYRGSWDHHEFLRALPARSSLRCIRAEDEGELFLDCHPLEAVG